MIFKLICIIRTLVGAGSSEFSRSQGMELVDPREMITENSLRDWRLWKLRLDNADDDSSHVDSIDSDKKDLPKEGYERGVEDDHSVLEDTVGAVSCDCEGMMAAGVSRFVLRLDLHFYATTPVNGLFRR